MWRPTAARQCRAKRSERPEYASSFGLCRWAPYVNVLSDETSCDLGLIVAMAGKLGYLA